MEYDSDPTPPHGLPRSMSDSFADLPIGELFGVGDRDLTEVLGHDPAYPGGDVTVEHKAVNERGSDARTAPLLTRGQKIFAGLASVGLVAGVSLIAYETMRSDECVAEAGCNKEPLAHPLPGASTASAPAPDTGERTPVLTAPTPHTGKSRTAAPATPSHKKTSKATPARTTSKAAPKVHTASGGQSWNVSPEQCTSWSVTNPLGVGQAEAGPVAFIDTCAPGFYDGATAHSKPAKNAAEVTFGTSFSTNESTILNGSIVHIVRAACGDPMARGTGADHTSKVWLQVKPSAGSKSGWVAAADAGFPSVAQLKAAGVAVSGC